MIPYIILIVLPTVPLLLNNGKRSPKSKDACFTLFFLTLIFMLSTKADCIGNDTLGYIYKFRQYSRMAISRILTEHEPFYGLLNYTISRFTDNCQWLFAISAILSTAPIYAFYKKYSDRPYLTIAIFVILSNFVMLFSGIRQSITIALGVLAFDMVKEKKIIPYILTVIVAFLFHNSAFMLVFLWPLYYLRITKKSLFFILPAIGIVAIYNKPIFTFLCQFVSDYYPGTIKNTGAGMMLVLFALLVVFAFVVPDEKQITQETIAMRNFLLFSLLIQIFASINSLVMRLGYYYTIFLPPLMANIIDCSSHRWRKVAQAAEIIMVLFFTVYFFTGLFHDNSLHTFPFVFFWEE